MSKAIAYVAEEERGFSVTVIDVEDPGTPCRGCGSPGPGAVYTVHCWREEFRPLVALCKPCAAERAGGEARVHVRTDRGGLQAGWDQGTRPRLSAKKQAQLKEARQRRAEQRA